MGKAKAPPPPDYAAAATAQGAANVEAAQSTAALNRPDQYDSNGSQTWSLKPGADPKNPQAGDWVVNTKLNQTQQALKDQQDALSSQYGNLASDSLANIGGILGSRFDTSGLPQAQALSANGLSAYGSAPTAHTPGSVGGPSAYELSSANPQTPAAYGTAQYGQAAGAGSRELGPGVDLNRAGLSAQGLNGYGSVSETSESSRQRITDALYARSRAALDPQTQQQSSDLTSQLAAQGITEGSEAFNRARDNQARQQSDAYANARNDAILAGGAEDSRIAAQNLQAAQFKNATRGQQFGEQAAIGERQNQNMDSVFGQGLASANFRNGVADTGWQQDMAALGVNNQSAKDRYQQEFDKYAFNAQRGDTAWQQQMSANQANNAARSNAFTQGLASQDFNNSAMQQYFQNQMASAGFANTSRGQQFGEAQAINSANNTLHSNAIQEALMQRQLGLNEANALRMGNQVGGMNFQQYGGAGQVGAAPIYQSTNDLYANQLAAVNAKNAGAGGMMSGIGQLGMAGAAMFMGSDRRLKRNIERIGTHKRGIGLYKYDYVWGQPSIGVMADEVNQIMPEAVVVDADGYQMVNYSMLEGV